MLERIQELLQKGYDYPEVTKGIPHGDMPGDKIGIDEGHVKKAQVIFPELLRLLLENGREKAVLCVSGGSGVGKSEIASILGYYLRSMGIGTYVLSGDNYPRRVPRDNDAERLRVYRTGGLKALLMSGCYLDEYGETLRDIWTGEQDADPDLINAFPWMRIYQPAAERSLDAYLGSSAEIDFDEVNGIIGAFKNGADIIPLKRMGRAPEDIFYSRVDFSGVTVLIIEWTHANSDFLQGIDVPVFLHSTPEETLAHRRARARDGKPDSAFIATVLRLEQTKLDHQARKAKLIIDQSGRLLTYDEYRRQMLTEESV